MLFCKLSKTYEMVKNNYKISQSRLKAEVILSPIVRTIQEVRLNMVECPAQV